MTPTITVNRRPLKTRLKAQWRLYVLLAPAIILTLVFSYAPLAGWYMAFTDYKLGGSMFAGKWTGLKQFAIFSAAPWTRCTPCATRWPSI